MAKKEFFSFFFIFFSKKQDFLRFLRYIYICTPFHKKGALREDPGSKVVEIGGGSAGPGGFHNGVLKKRTPGQCHSCRKHTASGDLLDAF
jgi:hypothetical protein